MEGTLQAMSACQSALTIVASKTVQRFLCFMYMGVEEKNAILLRNKYKILKIAECCGANFMPPQDIP